MDKPVQVIVQVREQIHGPRGCHGTVRRRTDIPQLLQHVQGVADAVGRLVQQLGKFHDPYRLVVCHSPGYLEVAADQFNLILHLFEHALNHTVRTVLSLFAYISPCIRLFVKPCPCLTVPFPEVNGDERGGKEHDHDEGEPVALQP